MMEKGEEKGKKKEKKTQWVWLCVEETNSERENGGVLM